MNRGSILHEDLTYAMLHEMVMKKFNLEAIYPLNLSAKVSSIDGNFDITDDHEIRLFVECASEDELAHLHAAIALAVQDEFPLAYHAVCCHHLMMNLSLKSAKTKALLWRICKAYATEEFSRNMSYLQDIQTDAYDKLCQKTSSVKVSRDLSSNGARVVSSIDDNFDITDDHEESLDLAIRLKALDEGYQFLNDISAPERHAAIALAVQDEFPLAYHAKAASVKVSRDLSSNGARVTLKKQKQSSSIIDPLAYLASTTHHLTPTQPTNPLPPTSSLTLLPQPATQSSNDAMLATMNQIVNLLSSFQKQFPPTNNQLRTSSNSKSHAIVDDGQIVTETFQRKALGNVGNTGTRGTQSYGEVTDNTRKLVIATTIMEKDMCQGSPLAITTTNIFEVSHEDAYDSNVDEGPHAAAAFMANLSSTSGINGATTSHVNEYQLDSKVQDVPTEVSSVSPSEISMITILDDLKNQLDGHLKEQSMVNDSLIAKLVSCKLEIQTLEQNKVNHDLDTTISQRNKRNAELEQENVLLKSNLSQKVKSINSLKTKSKKVLSEKKDLEERKITALTVKNAKLKSETLSKIHSKPIVPEKPKVLAPGIVEDHHRNLNKQNHVDSRLNVKRTGFVSNSNTVCNACNESLVFANNDNCVVRNLKYVNVKTPTAKHNVKTTKKVWKEKVVTIRSQWKPIGQRFTLYDEYPLTRIVEPIIKPSELTPRVNSNSKVNMIYSFTDYKLSNRKTGSKGISGIFEC
nr:transposase, MuDR, MULE transposase domain protein [Tanacetum cinerariifolium]